MKSLGSYTTELDKDVIEIPIVCKCILEDVKTLHSLSNILFNFA